MAQTTKEILAVQLRTELKPQLHVAAAGEARGPSAFLQHAKDHTNALVRGNRERMAEVHGFGEDESQAKPHDPWEQVEVVGSPDTSVERFPCSLDRRSR